MIERFGNGVESKILNLESSAAGLLGLAERIRSNQLGGGAHYDYKAQEIADVTQQIDLLSDRLKNILG